MTKKSTKTKTFTGTTHIQFVLDESGSMASVWKDTIGGYNAWLADMQKDDGDIRLSVMKFDTEYRPLELDVPIRDAKPLDLTRYQPRGATALLDAVAKCVGMAKDRVQEGDRALVVILTDGEENSSHEVTLTDVKRLISGLEDQGNWTFTYLSAAPDAFSDAGSLGIAFGNTARFAATAQGTADAFSTLSQSSRAYAGGQQVNSANFYTGDSSSILPPKEDDDAHSAGTTNSSTKPKSQRRTRSRRVSTGGKVSTRG